MYVYMLASAFAVASIVAEAQAPIVLTGIVPNCVPADGNALVSLTVQPELGWSTVRVYFRENGEDAWYFLEMRAAGSGLYWATLPKPEAATEKVDIRFVVTNDEGVETGGETQTVPVTSTCQVDLTAEQAGFANNLVVGETVPYQANKEVIGFQCDGIISRLEPSGDLRPDEYCRGILLAALVPKTRLLLLLPLAFVGGDVVDGGGPGEVSPVNP